MIEPADVSPAAGVIYTKSWVVDFMLDLVEYESAFDLGKGMIVDPGCGDGAFVVKIVERLLNSISRYDREPSTLANAIRAYDLDPIALKIARERILAVLLEHAVAEAVATSLVDEWVREEDFLLTDLSSVSADWVVGNPPYVRLEDLDTDVYTRYRERWPAMSGRADVYIGFFQAGLSLLREGGRLSFICADRWMHNQYGSALRHEVIEQFAMDLLFEVHDVDVFASRVAAYPAITVMRNGVPASTIMATALATFGPTSTAGFLSWKKADSKPQLAEQERDFTGAKLTTHFDADSSWPSGPPDRLLLIADLERRLPSITEVGITMGVGMATGLDRVFVVTSDIDIEAERLKPAIGPSDLVDGQIVWSGRYVVSPWLQGELASLSDYPRLRKYLLRNKPALSDRYVAKKNPANWWRTIDKPRPDEYSEPKLIVADINDRIEPVLDSNGFWPLHSAYFIKSSTWEIEALGGFLLSDVAAAFVEAYSVKMANGHLRVSAQYLKRIRIPKFEDVDRQSRDSLAKAFRDRDRGLASSTVRNLLQLS